MEQKFEWNYVLWGSNLPIPAIIPVINKPTNATAIDWSKQSSPINRVYHSGRVQVTVNPLIAKLSNIGNANRYKVNQMYPSVVGIALRMPVEKARNPIIGTSHPNSAATAAVPAL
jgi:hypothetical protein